MTALTVLGEMLPNRVAVVERFGAPELAPLYPEEEALVARAVAKRRLEFAAARWCARTALRELGVPPAPILSGPRGAPQWPNGVVGSVTHCDGFRAAAVARTRDVASIGIDAEPHRPLPDGVLDKVASGEEQAHLLDLARSKPSLRWDMLLFSAKESVYKAWYPLTLRWLGFTGASLVIDADLGTFAARLSVPGPVVGDSVLTGFDGRWLVRRGLVLTCVVLAAPQRDARSGEPR